MSDYGTGLPPGGRLPAIVLAGGAGTRLTPVIRDLPKPMAPINGRPFLEILLEYLIGSGIDDIVIAVGYRREAIQAHFGSRWQGACVRYCIEDTPLGTGGALKKAMDEAGCPRAFAMNGDSFCPVNLAALRQVHGTDAALTIALRRVEDVARFGTVETDADGKIKAFREKSTAAGSGLINAGIYLIERKLFDVAPPGPAFSFEADIMQKHCGTVTMRGMVTEAPFIDIGVPEEYRRAQDLLR